MMGSLDRRIPFFAVASLVSFGLRFVLLESEKSIVKTVPVAIGVIYAVLAALYFLQWFTTGRPESFDLASTAATDSTD